MASEATMETKNNIMCIDEEREALLDVKNDIEIDRCGLLTSWGTGEENKDCCQWEGVRCSRQTRNVIMLDLNGAKARDRACLEGNLSPSLLKLTHLGYLDLSYNDFRGQPIPSFIGSLTKLQHLNLSHSGFCGEVPHQLENLSYMQSLHLSCTSQSQSCLNVENLEWLSNLISLEHIDFISVDLSRASNWLQVINNLPSLKFLRMEACKLGSPIRVSPSSQSNISLSLRVLDLGNNYLDTSIYQWLFDPNRFSGGLIEVINLSRNQLKGPVPNALGNFHSLRYLDASENEIGCQIPDSIGNLEHLIYLDLSKNFFQGCTLPKTFSKLCNLKSLHLMQNDITEELPNFLQRLCSKMSLEVLDLSDNNLWGSIPDMLSMVPSLKRLSIDNNRLNGTVSESLGQLSKLEVLSISSNLLNVTLSDKHFQNLSKLHHLDLSNNSFLVLNCSPNWVPSFRLDTINLRSCALGPKFPMWLQTQRRLSYLDISDAGISDCVPKAFWNLLTPELSYLNMSNNMITGAIPNLSVKFDYLNPPDIDLSSNSFEGVIPSFLGNVSSLSLSYNKFTNSIQLLCSRSKVALFDLDLSNNLLSGELPDDCWLHTEQLSFLNLETNNFSGNLPTSLGALQHLQTFRLCDNNFSGELPVSLWNCTSLVILDIGDNHFSGHIPTQIGDVLHSLVVLNLRKNKYVGSIPTSLCRLSDLQIVDLSGNSITGTLPKCISNFTAMTNKTVYLPSSCRTARRRFRYPYAAWVNWKRVQRKFGDLLGQVKSLDFSNNDLEGEIPAEIYFLAGLVSIDLSRNKLNGSITPKIYQLQSLEFLDLSNNQLCGEIPDTLAKLSFLSMLDLSNNKLTGGIPKGTQLQSFEASAYMRNPELCGAPLTNICPGSEAPDNTNGLNSSQQDKDDNNDILSGLYISIAVGCVTGFWGVCVTLLLKRSLREHYFRVINEIGNKFSMINLFR